MKLPCRHIMTVIGCYSIEMFSIRWLVTYQHAFLKEGYEKLTEVFRQMELFEFERNNDFGETIFVKKPLSMLSAYDIPIKIGLTNSIDVSNMKLMINAGKKFSEGIYHRRTITNERAF